MRADPLVQVLLHPASAAQWSGAQWTEVFRKARFSGLTGRLASRLQSDATTANLGPPALQRHLQAALRVCQAQRDEVMREARHLDLALASLGAPVILLKGAAYAAASLPAAQGRVFSDIDILVPKAQLAQTEALLTLHGWVTTEDSDYNQNYYRQWMHELPPMRHIQRGTVLDVHHTILPETARLKPDASKLIASAVPLPGTRVLHVLSDTDMLLHSMTHLFMNDDMTHALRDLSDLEALMRGLGADDARWAQLVLRAAELGLGRPLCYALQQLVKLMQLQVPHSTWAQVQHLGPGPALGMVMEWVWSQALSTPVPPARIRGRSLALGLLYLRGHWLRMPPALLARHLFIKSLGLHQTKKTAEKTAGHLRVDRP